jgi:ribonuclease J
VTTYGLVSDREDHAFAKEMEEVLLNYIKHAKPYVFEKNRVFETELRGVVRKHIFRSLKKYPMIVPTVFFQ